MSSGPRATACFSCKKQKVRCRMDGGKPPCLRCRQRQTTCKMQKHDIPQDDENNLAAALMHDIQVLHTALDEMRCANAMPPLTALRTASIGLSNMNGPASNKSPPSSTELDEDLLMGQDPQSPAPEGDIDRNPIRSLYKITRLRSLRSQQISPPSTEVSNTGPWARDLISRNLLEYGEASRLVQNYLTRSDHYLYDVAGKFKDLDGVRAASPLLLTAVCAVGAMQDTSADKSYIVCRAELRRLILDFIFKPSMDLEDLRGLVISAFWLSDISWAVSGLAIRRALEVDLQNSFKAVTQIATIPIPNLEAVVERMKLWYLLYICDQHLSILYARTPMLGHQESIREFESFLNALPDSTCNQRLMSQVSLLRTLRAVSDLFGVDTSEAIPPVFKPQLDSFNQQIDTWASKWLSSYSSHPVVGDYPSKAVSMHYYFAKLVVCAHVFRGLTNDPSTRPLPDSFATTAKSTVQSAQSILSLTVQDEDITTALTGLPHYFHSMIAYACAFLVKAITRYQMHIEIDQDETRNMISQVVQLCSSSECGQHHLVKWIGKGLDDLLNEYSAPTQARSRPSNAGTSQSLVTNAEPSSDIGQQQGPVTGQQNSYQSRMDDENAVFRTTISMREPVFSMPSPELQRICTMPGFPSLSEGHYDEIRDEMNDMSNHMFMDGRREHGEVFGMNFDSYS